MNSLIDDDEPSVNIKEGIDINDLKDPQGKGVVFEVEEEEQPSESDTTNRYFNPDHIVENLYHPESSSDTEEEDDVRGQFERMMLKMEDISEDKDGGIMKKILTPGTGPIVPRNASVRIHYNGYLEYADEPFDSTRLRKCEEKKRLGKGDMFIGFERAVLSMKKGEMSRFIIRPKYAFGKMGCPPRIPQDASLLYDIELLNFLEKDEVDDYYRMTPEERTKVSFENVCKICRTEKSEAEQFYKDQMWKKAVSKYLKVCRVLEDVHLKNDEEQQSQQKQLVKVYTNIANCYVKSNEPKRAIPFANRALEIDPKHVKAYFWKAKALHSLANFDQARTNLIKAQKIAPNSADINKELIKLNENFKKFKLQETTFCRKMFSGTKQDTDDSKEIEDKKEEKMFTCSDDFKKAYNNRLKEFIADQDVNELPFPSYQLSVPEIEYMLEVALEKGLHPESRGTGDHVNFVIRKKKKENS